MADLDILHVRPFMHTKERHLAVIYSIPSKTLSFGNVSYLIKSGQTWKGGASELRIW